MVVDTGGYVGEYPCVEIALDCPSGYMIPTPVSGVLALTLSLEINGDELDTMCGEIIGHL